MSRAIALDERADAGLPQLLGDGDEPLALGASQDQAEPPKEGVRVPLRRPTPAAEPAAKKPEDVISTPTQPAVAGEIVQPESEEEQNRKAAEPTAAEIAAHEAAQKAETTDTAASSSTGRRRAAWVDKK
jgi:hypothetical protein